MQNTRLDLSKLLNNKSHGQSGFRFISDGPEALLWRILLADEARESIAIQYYIWKNDESGKIVMHHLLKAADRGVKITILLDAYSQHSHPKYLAVLSAHPLIDVRFYHPFGFKGDFFLLNWLSFLFKLPNSNYRMHNKIYMVDNKYVLMGGRNIGNEYFEYADEYIFNSGGVFAVGEVVKEVRNIVAMYWNSPFVKSVTMYVKGKVDKKDRKSFTQSLNECVNQENNYPFGFFELKEQLLNKIGDNTLEMCLGEGELLYDPLIIKKLNHGYSEQHIDGVGERLKQLVLEVQKEVLIESPYLVLPSNIQEIFRDLITRNIKVKILTNSLAANDVLLAGAAYKSQRKNILKTGVDLYEYKSEAKLERRKFAKQIAKGKKMLFGFHAKTAVFDEQYSFVGSFNLDSRSININTETGLLIKSVEFAGQLKKNIIENMLLENAWHISIDKNGKVMWQAKGDDGKEIQLYKDPNLSIWRRIVTFFASLLPLSSQA